MSPLRDLGLTFLGLAVAMFFAHKGMKKTDQLKIKSLPQLFDRQSNPALFEAGEKATAWTAAIALVLGVLILALQP
jgi:hypothetical protein